MRSHASRLRPRWAAPAVLALALGWPLGAAAECTSGEGCLTTALDSLVGGFTGAAGSDLWGWMIGGGQSAGPDQITSELQSIQSTLETISSELVDIESELSQLQCGIDADFIAQYAGPIQYYYETYADWLTDMQSGALPSLVDVSQWANCAVGSPTGGQTCQDSNIITLMNELNDAATAAAGSGGSISDCVAAKAGQPPAGSLDDRPYYIDNVQPITDWYFTINTQAMIVLTEAYHFRAWQQAGSPTSSSADDIIANVCPAGSSLDDCAEPITKYGTLGTNATGEFLPFVYGQFKAGGAPLSTDSNLVVNGEGQMLVRSIEVYNEASGISCPDPQVDPTCGSTIGSWNFYAPASYPVGPYGFGGGDGAGIWGMPDASVFDALLNQGFNQPTTQPSEGTVTPGEFLCTMSMTSNPASCTQANGGLGLENADKFLWFPQSLPSFNVENNFTIGPFACFMDGYMSRAVGTQPYCSQATFENILATGRNDFGCSYFYAVVQADAASNIPYYPGWYDAHICFYSGEPPVISERPGYLAPGITPGWDFSGFWWPSLPLDTITCDNGKSALDASNLNPAGLPQLCRQKDFNIWFQTIVPPGPTTTTAIADATLDAAAPNTNDGASAELELAGGPHGGTEVALVGFDPAQLQAFLEAGPLDNAQLFLTRLDTSVDASGRGPQGKGKKDGRSLLVLRPLRSDFVEGNGDAAGPDRGTGSGTTWNCAEDADIANDSGDCLQYWALGGGWEAEWGTSNQGGGGEALQFVEAGEGGRVGWDVTEAVRRGVHAWALQVRGNDGLALVSREGAAALGDPGLAPTLILTHPVEQSVSLNE